MRYDRVFAPETPDGEIDWKRIAETILLHAEGKPAGDPYFYSGCEGDEPRSYFLVMHDGHDGVIIHPESIASRFGASLYMALEALAPKRVSLWEASDPSQTN